MFQNTLRYGLNSIAALPLFLMAGCASMPGLSGAGSLVTTDSEIFTLSWPLADYYDYALIRTGAVDVAGPSNVAPEVVTLKQTIDTLADYDVIFVGEAHGHVGNHRLQLQVLRDLYARDPNIALSMEQFERDVQGVVNDFLAGEIGEQVLKKEGRAWPHYSQSYRPLVEFAKVKGLSVIAAEAPTDIVRCVGQEGPGVVDKFNEEQRSWVAKELHVDEGAYKDKYMRFLSASMSHGAAVEKEGAKSNPSAPSEGMERRFAAQISRDDTMAESIFFYLQNNPGSKVVHLNGSFHSAGFLATVERLKMRMPELKIAVVHPILVDDVDIPSFTQADLGEGTFLALLQPVPEDFIQPENMNAFIQETMKTIRSNRCTLI